MRNLDLKLTVLPDRRAIVQLPADFEPGETEVTLIVRKRPIGKRTSILDRLPSVDTGNWPADLTFSREQLYSDGDR